MKPKRPRCDDTPGLPTTPTSWTLSPVLAAELTTGEVPVVDVWTGVVADRRQASRLIRELSTRSPVTQLLHLKRCAGDRIILALAIGSADACVDRLVAAGVDLAGLREATDVLHEDIVADPAPEHERSADVVGVDAMRGADSSGRHQILVYRQSVPACKPRSRRQYDAALRHWPSNFHEDRRLERLLAGTEFSASQLATFGGVMASCVATGHGVGVAAAVVDPKTGAVLAMRRDTRDAHPLKHAVMEVVDAIARLQGGGAWCEDVCVPVGVGEASRPCEPLASVLAHRKRGRTSVAGEDGGDGEEIELPDLLSEVQETDTLKKVENECHEKGKITQSEGADKLNDIYPVSGVLKIAAKQLEESAGTEKQDGVQSARPAGPKTGPYLCTGYDVFVTREPCAMCAMALVHARARRVFFGCAAPGGALRSHAQLHLVRSLNHNYEVYGGVLEQECRELWERRDA